MLQMLEFVGTSPLVFSEAVQSALAEVAARSFKAHFFQVVLKVAVEG